jgi:hypothetical protein
MICFSNFSNFSKEKRYELECCSLVYSWLGIGRCFLLASLAQFALQFY